MARLRRSLAGALVIFAARTACGDNASSGGAEDTSSSPLFSADGPVASLTRSTFISSVLESQKTALVWFYPGPDCSQCEELPSVVEAAAQKLASWGVLVAAVDTERDAKLAKELGMASGSSSTLKMYHSESTRNPYGGLPIRPEEYIGSFKDARGLQKKVLSAIPNWVVTIDVGGVDASPLKKALAEGGEDYAAVLVTEAGKSSPVLRVLGSEVRGKVSAVQARMPKPEGDEEDEERSEVVTSLLKGAFELKGAVTALPSLLLVDKKSGAATVFAGVVDDAKAVLAFIREGARLPSPSTASGGGSASGDDAASDSGKQAPREGELALDEESLALLEERGIEALVVAFVERGDTAVIPGWREATKSLQGQIRAAVLDCSAHPTLCEAGAKKAPHIRVYPHKRGLDGDNRGVPSMLPASQIKEAVSEAEASLPEIVSVIPPGVGFGMTQDTVQAFVSSTIIGDGSPMVLFVLSKREEPNLVVKTVAAEFQTAKIRVMFISQPDQEVLSSLGISRLPSMVLMFQATDEISSQGNRPPLEEGEQPMVTASYSPAQWGPVSHRSISDFILAHLGNVDKELFFKHVVEMSETHVLNGEKMNPQLDMLLDEYNQSGASSTSQGSGDNNRHAAPFQGVGEATSDSWESMGLGEGTGSDQPRTVGVFMLDRYSESFGSAFAAAEQAAEKAVERDGRGGGSRFVWVDAPCQEGFAKAFGVSDTSEVPVLVVFSPKHQKSARFVGAWEADSLTSFLVKAMGGRAPMFPVGEETPRLEAIDCSQRALPSWLAGGSGDGEGGDVDDGMGDFMAEILAEEAKAKQELEEEVARGMQELREAEAAEEGKVAPKKKKKIVKRKKKKQGSGSTEL